MNIIQEYKEQIEKLQSKIVEIQDWCSHPKAALTSVNKSDTGNYDPSCDSFWTEFHCGLCEKRWTEDQ